MYSPISQFMKALTVVPMIVVLLAHVAEAQVSVGGTSSTTQPEGVAVDGDEYALLTYEVGDLVLHVADFPYSVRSTSIFSRGLMGGGMGGGGGFGGGPVGAGGGLGGGGGQNLSSGSNRITMDGLISVLTRVVAPTSWNRRGGGVVQQLGTSLVVWQTRAQHRQIDNLLKQLREGAGDRKTVAIDARWLLLNSDELGRLIPPDQNGDRKIDRGSLASFTRRPTSIRGLTNCFSGQLVYIVSGTRRNITSSFIPVVGSIDSRNSGEQLASRTGGTRIMLASQRTFEGGGSPPNVGYQPIVETTNFGALLEIRPTLIRGKNTAVIELRSTLTVLAKQSGKSAGQVALSPGAPIVDKIPIDRQELATTLRIRLGQPVLVGGLTYISPSFEFVGNDAQSGTTQNSGATAENRQLYLVLEIR